MAIGMEKVGVAELEHRARAKWKGIKYYFKKGQMSAFRNVLWAFNAFAAPSTRSSYLGK